MGNVAESRDALTAGTYADPAVLRAEGRARFWEALSAELPAVVIALQMEPLKLALADGLHDSEDLPVPYWHFAALVRRHLRGATPLGTHLDEWTRENHLADGGEWWPAAAALWTLFRWAQANDRGDSYPLRVVAPPLPPGAQRAAHPTWEDPWTLDHRMGAAVRATTAVTHLGGPSWNPAKEPRREAEARLFAEAKRRVMGDLDRIEAQAVAEGEQVVPWKPSERDHLLWLVRYQVAGASLTELAAPIGKSRQAVSRAIHETAAWIGLTVRQPNPPGRPRRQPAARIVKVPHRRRV